MSIGVSERESKVAASGGTQAQDTIRYITCGSHCANGGCPIKVRIRDGKIVNIEPDDTINPGIAREDSHLPQDWLDKCMFQIRPCAKGFAQVHMLSAPERVLYPMKRVGERGEAKFERISWDEALDTIAAKLVEIKQKYGPYSIVSSHMDTFPIAPWFGAAAGAWGSHSSQGWNETMNWVLGIRVRAERCDESNMLNARLIVNWGANRPSTLSDAGTYTLLRARERGIPVICIETRYTAAAETLADQWIPIRATTDAAMMIAMANVFFKEGLCDNDYIARYVEPEGLRQWKAYVLGTNDGVDKTPEWAEKICGVPAQTIAEFARLYACSKPVHLSVPLSMGRQFYGENPTRAAMYLQALTGNATIPGGTAGAEAGHAFGEHGPRSLPMPRVEWGKTRGPYRPPVLGVHFRWPLAVDLREKLDSGEMSEAEYNAAIGNVPGNVTPNIRAIIIHGTNPVITHPDANTNIRAYKKLDFLAVFSYHKDNPSARYADILLPQINMHYEGRDVGGGGDEGGGGGFFAGGRNFNGNYFAYRQKCVDPPGEVRPKEWFWVQLARRLGFAEQYNPRLANVPYEKWEEVFEELHRDAYEKWMVRPEIAPLNPPTWEEFQKRPVFRWDVKEPYYPFKNALDKGENPFKGTDSGKIEFLSRELGKGADYLAANAFATGSERQAAGPEAVPSHAIQGRWYGGGHLPPIAEMTLGGKATFHSKDTEKFPLLVSTPHALFRMHSFMDNQPLLSEDCYRHAIWINVADARARGIVDNDKVRVYNDLAEMVLPAYVTQRTVPGTVVIFHGGWYRPGGVKTDLMPEGIDMRGAPNLLTRHDEHLPDTIINHLPCKALVEVKKWEES